MKKCHNGGQSAKVLGFEEYFKNVAIKRCCVMDLHVRRNNVYFNHCMGQLVNLNLALCLCLVCYALKQRFQESLSL